MQNRTTTEYHVTSVKLAIIKKMKDGKYWKRCGEKGTLVYY
jgi:hypothetical protein